MAALKCKRQHQSTLMKHSKDVRECLFCREIVHFMHWMDGDVTQIPILKIQGCTGGAKEDGVMESYEITSTGMLKCMYSQQDCLRILTTACIQAGRRAFVLFTLIDRIISKPWLWKL